MPRPSCLSCARKHLGQALVLMLEAQKGYPQHAWVAVGHLAEAEDELLQDYRDLANVIRAHRVEYMIATDDGRDYEVPMMDLIQTIVDMVAEEYQNGANGSE